MMKLSRPNFFPGQWIDYRDLNRVAGHSDRLLGVLNRAVFTGGGVLLNALEEFSVSPQEGLVVRIRPGLALLPNGELVTMTEDCLLDLKNFLLKDGQQTLVVGIRNVVTGADRFTDELDASITGFKTEVFEPQVFAATELGGSDCIELFRVHLSLKAKTLRLANTGEEWSLTAPQTDTEGILDLRFRPTVLPVTYAPVGGVELISLREALYRIEECHRKIRKIYLIDDPFNVPIYVTQLHMEVLARPFQALKAAFLLAELAEKYALFLEVLQAKLGKQAFKYDRETLMTIAETLEPLRRKEVFPRNVNLAALVGLADLLSTFTAFAEEKFSLLDMVEEGLLDLRGRAFPFEEKITVAGYPFERTDLISAQDSARVQLLADQVHGRAVKAQFASGDTLSLKGSFIQKGTIQMQIRAPKAGSPTVLLCHQYLRRTGTEIRYEVNGRALKTETFEYQDTPNQWLNGSAVIPADFLTQESNTLRIHVDKTDLDFGFFDLAVYQPIATGEARR